VARVVAEMYRIENVIYVRIKAVADAHPVAGSTARIVSYRPKARVPIGIEWEAAPVEPTAPPGPIQR
jgi:hypothetical protein